MVGARVLLSLAAVLGLLIFMQRRIAKGSRRRERRANPVEVVARKGVGSKASVVVIDVDGARYLLGVTEHNVTVLNAAAAPQPTEPAVVAPAPAESIDGADELDLTEFDRMLAAAAAEPVTTPLTRKQARLADEPAASGTGRTVAGGSILSPDTWRQTAAFLRQGR